MDFTAFDTSSCTASSISMAIIRDAMYKIIEARASQPFPEIITNSLMVERVLYKKPRKKKNRRWDKKYWKKYSCLRPMKVFLLDQANKKLYCHPSTESTLWELWDRRK